MTGAPEAAEDNATALSSGRAPSYDIDAGLKPSVTEHGYGSQGIGALRHPLREPRASHIYFVVKDPPCVAVDAEIVFHTSDNTWNAYNSYGGTSMYGSFGTRWDTPPAPRSFKASFNRPMVTRDYRAINAPFGAEYPCLRFLEKAGYKVTYQTAFDTHQGLPYSALPPPATAERG